MQDERLQTESLERSLHVVLSERPVGKGRLEGEVRLVSVAPVERDVEAYGGQLFLCLERLGEGVTPRQADLPTAHQPCCLRNSAAATRAIRAPR